MVWNSCAVSRNLEKRRKREAPSSKGKAQGKFQDPRGQLRANQGRGDSGSRGWGTMRVECAAFQWRIAEGSCRLEGRTTGLGEWNGTAWPFRGGKVDERPAASAVSRDARYDAPATAPRSGRFPGCAGGMARPAPGGPGVWLPTCGKEGKGGGYAAQRLARMSFQRFHAASRALRLASLASGASPARIKP